MGEHWFGEDGKLYGPAIHATGISGEKLKRWIAVPYAPAPVSEPVVRYYRRVGPVDNPERSNVVLKEVDGKIAEYFKNNEPVAQPIGKQIVPEWYRQITPAEYEAARKPAKHAIEPLGNYPDMKKMRDKINELITRHNALEKRVAGMEAK